MVLRSTQECKGSFWTLKKDYINLKYVFNLMSTQKFWVAWQTVVSFVIPALTIIACWAILIYLFLTRQFQRYANWFVLNEVGANMNWSISYSQDCPNAFEKSLKNRYIHITGFCSILKSVTLKAMFVTGFFLLCASPFCISFFVVISIIILMVMTILVMIMVLAITFQCLLLLL